MFRWCFRFGFTFRGGWLLICQTLAMIDMLWDAWAVAILRFCPFCCLGCPLLSFYVSFIVHNSTAQCWNCNEFPSALDLTRRGSGEDGLNFVEFQRWFVNGDRLLRLMGHHCEGSQLGFGVSCFLVPQKPIFSVAKQQWLGALQEALGTLSRTGSPKLRDWGWMQSPPPCPTTTQNHRWWTQCHRRKTCPENVQKQDGFEVPTKAAPHP